MRFRTRPIEVEAVQWTGENADEIDAFVKASGWKFATVTGHPGEAVVFQESNDQWLSLGDWIVKDQDGQFESMDPDQFAATYEPADESPEGASKERAVVEAARAFLKSLEMEYGNITFSDEIMALQAALAALDASGRLTPDGGER